MATKYWYKSGSGSSNWGTTGINWFSLPNGGGTTNVNPANTDDVIIDSGSHSGSILILEAAKTCNSFVATDFKGRLSGSLGLSVTSTTTNRTSSAFPLFAWSSAMTQSYTGTTTFAGSAANTGGWIFCNGTRFSGSATFNNTGTGATFTLKDSFKLPTGSTLTLTNGIVSASDSSVNIETGFISTATGTKTLICPHLYLTGVGALFTTSTTNLTSNITNIYVTGSTSTAKTLLFNTVFGSTNLYLGGSGSIAFTPGTTFVPNVYVTNTGGLATIFNIAATGTITSLTFSTPVTWTNTISVVLTLRGSMTLLSTMAIQTRTPALTFTTNNPTITLAGKTLLTGAITISGVAATAVGDFVPGVGLTISNGGSLTTPSSTTFTVPTLALQNGILNLSSSPNTITGATTISGGGTNTLNGNAVSMSSTVTITTALTTFNINSADTTGGALTSTGTGTTGVPPNGQVIININANNVSFNSITTTFTNMYATSSGTDQTIRSLGPLTLNSHLQVSASNIYATNIPASINTNPFTKLVTCDNLYLTGDGTVQDLIVSQLDLTSNINNIYITGSGASAKTLTTYNNATTRQYFYGNNIYLAGIGTGRIKYAQAANQTYYPNVYVTNTGPAQVSISTATLNSVTFSPGTTANWSNDASQVLTLQGNLTLTGSMTSSLTPAITFTTNNPTITIAEKKLVTGTVTLDGVTGTMDSFSGQSIPFSLINGGKLNSPDFSTTGTVTLNSGSLTATNYSGSAITLTNYSILSASNCTGTAISLTDSTGSFLNLTGSTINITSSLLTSNNITASAAFTLYSSYLSSSNNISASSISATVSSTINAKNLFTSQSFSLNTSTLTSTGTSSMGSLVLLDGTLQLQSTPNTVRGAATMTGGTNTISGSALTMNSTATLSGGSVNLIYAAGTTTGGLMTVGGASYLYIIANDIVFNSLNVGGVSTVAGYNPSSPLIYYPLICTSTLTTPTSCDITFQDIYTGTYVNGATGGPYSKTINCTNFYFTGDSLTLHDSGVYLTSNITNIYITGSGSGEKKLALQSTATSYFTAPNIYLSGIGTGKITLVPGANTLYQQPNVYVTSTTAEVSFSTGSSTGNIGSLIFSPNTKLNNTSTASVLSLYGDLTLTGSMTVSQFPTIDFSLAGYPSIVTMDGITLTSPLTVNNGSSLVVFADNFISNTTVDFLETSAVLLQDNFTCSSLTNKGYSYLFIGKNLTTGTFTLTAGNSGASRVVVGQVYTLPYNGLPSGYYSSSVTATAIDLSTANTFSPEMYLLAGAITCSSITATDASYFSPNPQASYPTIVSSSGDVSFTQTSWLDSSNSTIICGGTLTTDSTGSFTNTSITCSDHNSTTATVTLDNSPVSCSGAATFTGANLTILGSTTPYLCNTFRIEASATFIGTTLNMGENSRLIVAGAGDAFSSGTTSTIITETNSIIEFTDTSTSILTLILGGTGTYENIILNRGASTGTTIIRGSAAAPNGSVIRNFRDLGTAAHDISYGSNTHTILDTYDVKGSPGKIVNIARSAGASSTVLKKGNPGLVVCDYIAVNNITAQDYTGSTTQGTWFAGPNSTLTSTTTGWSTTGSHATASIVRRLGSQGAG